MAKMIYVGCSTCGKEVPEFEALWAKVFGIEDNPIDQSRRFICRDCATKVLDVVKNLDREAIEDALMLTEIAAKA